MARIIPNLPNATTPDSDYPYGRIKDNDGTGNGVAVNEFTNGDFHQFFARLMDQAGISANGLPDNDYTGFQLVEALAQYIRDTAAADSAVITNDGAKLRTKVVEIGDWNMNSTSGVNIAHGLPDVTKIRSVSVIIRSDGSTIVYDFLSSPGVDQPSTALNISKRSGTIAEINSTNIELDQKQDDGSSSSFFDGTGFDSTSFNRGWITIVYEE